MLIFTRFVDSRSCIRDLRVLQSSRWFSKTTNLLLCTAGQNDFPSAENRVSNTTDFLRQIRTCRGFNRRREYKVSTLATVDSPRPQTITVPSLTPTHYEIPCVSRRKTAERGSSFEFHGWSPDDDWCTRRLLPTLETSSLCSLPLQGNVMETPRNTFTGTGTSAASIFFSPALNAYIVHSWNATSGKHKLYVIGCEYFDLYRFTLITFNFCIIEIEKRHRDQW